ncbi:hypothetical protein EWH99_10750 [Sporolactobacillus sp. THM7-7]|nr:hypothetical protein EWH99_10750 [Sporolactobacillus sp. THM7-7]
MTDVRSLKDNKGTVFYPRTHAKAVDGLAEAVGEQIDYPVISVAGKTGDVALGKSDVGLSNVDNTADADKPVSGPMQTALDKKQDEILVSPSGSKFLLSVDDDGTLSTTPYTEGGTA